MVVLKFEFKIRKSYFFCHLFTRCHILFVYFSCSYSFELIILMFKVYRQWSTEVFTVIVIQFSWMLLWVTVLNWSPQARALQQLKPSSKDIEAHSFQQNPSLLNPSPQGGSEAIIAGYFTLCGRMVPEVLGFSAYPRHYLFEDRINLVSKKPKPTKQKRSSCFAFILKA